MFVLFIVSVSFSQYYFGRNKVIYNNFTWYILKTEHFDIYYYPEMRELAEIGAAAAEESYNFLEKKFNHSIDRRIPLIFYSNHIHFQQTNTTPAILPEGVGGFFEFIKGRVVIPANGSIPEFKRVIRHELVHVFTHSLHYRILKDHRRTHFPALPLWFVEGIAEYWSIGWDEQAEMFIKDAVLHNYLVPLSSMYQIYGTFLMYKEGQAILKYISEKYGEEKIIQLIRNAWKEEHFSNVMQLTILKTYEQFDKEWLYYLKKKYYPELAKRDFPEMASRKLTTTGINTKPAFFRTNGSPKVAFVSNRSGYSNIYQMVLLDSLQLARRRSRKIEILVKGERTSDFESFHILSSKIDVNNRNELCFVSKSGSSDAIYIYDIASKQVMKKFRNKNIVTMFSPAWSTDGRFIAFSGIDFSGKCDLYILDVASNKLTRLTNDYFSDRDPVWDSLSEFLYFTSDRTAINGKHYYNLYALRIESGEIFHLTYGAHNDYSPAISPDDNFLAFTSDRDGALNIWMIENGVHSTKQLLASRAQDEAETPLPAFAIFRKQHQARKITNFTTGAQDPEWTDDGRLLFTAFENFSFQIQILDRIALRYKRSDIIAHDSISVKSEFPFFQKITTAGSITTVRYKPKFNLDVAQSAVTQDPMFGTSGGAQLAISDMLGNYQYHFLVFNNAQTKDEFLESFNVAISRLDLSHRTNYAVGLYHFAGRYFNWYDGFFYERWYGGFASVSYPLSTFERIEGNINFRQSYKEWYGSGYSRSALLLSNFVGYVKDNSLWGPTGPLDGERINVTIGNTSDVRHSNVNFYTIIFDARKYFRLSRMSAFAVRAMTRFNHGKEALPFYMGGSWDLRGYKRWSLWGKKLFLINNELRFPFIDRFLIKFPFGGMTFSAIRGATFLDLGNAWDDHLDSVLGSLGFGIRFRLGGVLVLRLDFGKRFAFNDIHHLLDADKFSMQSGYFKQFFFGWDF